MTSITISDSVTSIGDWAFYGCENLKNIIFNGTRSQWDKIGYETEIPVICTGDTSTVSKTFDGGTSTYNLERVRSITIPDGVTSIEAWSFSNNSGLTSITIPDSVTSIGYGAFSGCSGLTSIIVEPSNSMYHSEGNCLIETASKTLIAGCINSVIPNDGSVISIGGRAFCFCAGLTSITIPNSVTSIGYGAFSGCSGLTSITIPNRVRSIGDWAFSGCRSLTSMTIPDSVTSIGEDAFSDCSGLTSIIIPNSVTSIGYRAFYGCIGLKSITIPDSVASIGFRAFYGCENLKNINFTGTRSQWDKIGYETEIPVICTGDTSTVSKTFDGGTSTGSMI